ncbi:MAG: tyrosine-type recombinase/integrase [Phycisphaerales bacterium]
MANQCSKGLTKKEKAELKAWYKQYHWHPHQLRHNAATFLRKEFGIDTARIILGHRSAVITEVYAELDQQKAMDAVIKVG